MLAIDFRRYSRPGLLNQWTNKSSWLQDNQRPRTQLALFTARRLEGHRPDRPGIEGLQVPGHGAQVGLGQVLRAAVDHFGHRPNGRCFVRDAVAQQVHDALRVPLGHASFGR